MRPFDLAHGPLVRVRLVRLGAEDALLLLTFHHIVSDGWSLNVLLAEVSQLYADARAGRDASLPALPIQYVDYAAWQRAYLGAGAEARQLAYWKAQLAEAPTMLALPLDPPAVRELGVATLPRKDMRPLARKFLQFTTEMAEKL